MGEGGHNGGRRKPDVKSRHWSSRRWSRHYRERMHLILFNWSISWLKVLFSQKKKKKKVLFFLFSVDEYVTWKMCTTMSLFSGFYEMSKGIITLDAYDFYVIFLG